MLGVKGRLRVRTDGAGGDVRVQVDVSMRPMLVRLLAAPVGVISAVILAVPLFLVGERDWWRAWVLVAVFALTSLVVLTPWLSIDILVVRATAVFRRDDPVADRLLIGLAIAPLLAWYLLMPADVFHLHLLAKPPLVVSAAGLALVVVGMALAVLVERANPFAAPAITHLKERDHRVIDVGPYRYVRHPMYAGGICMFIGLPMWLESTTATVLAVVPILVLVQRIRIEERFLQSHLDGYSAFMQRVRYRLVPRVW